MGSLTNTLVKGSPAKEAPPPEFCVECGEFVSTLHELSGWCYACSKELGYKISAAELREVLPTTARDRCFNGHPYEPGSWAYRPNRKGIVCRVCDRESSERKRQKVLADIKNPNSKYHGTKSGARTGCQCKKCHAEREKYNVKRRVTRRY